MTQEICRILGVLFLSVCIAALGFRRLHQEEKADFKFEIGMGKDINRIGRELKAAGLDDRTVRILKSALEDVQRNTQRYVQDRSFHQSLDSMFLASMIVVLWVASTSQRLKQRNSIP